MCGTQGQLQRSCEENDSKHHLPPRRLECLGFSAELWLPPHRGNFARRVTPSGLPTRVGLPGQLPEARRPVREFPRRLEAPPGQLSYNKNSAVFVSGSGSTPQTTPEFMLMRRWKLRWASGSRGCADGRRARPRALPDLTCSHRDLLS